MANIFKAFSANAYLGNADLSGSNLIESNLIGANLSNADLKKSDITGTRLYTASFTDRKIEGIRCDYVFWDTKGKVRTPNDRNFEPGEFEELYKSLPTFEYHFVHGFTPIDAMVMDQVVHAINERHPEFELKLDSLHSRGQPHAKFTILHKENTGPALEEITRYYETRIKVLEGQKDQLMEVVSMLSSRPQMIQNIHAQTAQGITQTGEIDTMNQDMRQGDDINVESGRDAAVAKDQGKAEIKS